MVKARKAKSGDVWRYYDLQRHWTRKIVPHLKDRTLNEILVRDFNKYTMGRWRKPFRKGSLPEDIDSFDWRDSHHGRPPRYWSYVAHGACHWIANFALRLAERAEPNRAWRIVTSQEHTTIWDGQKTLFDFDYLAFGIPVVEAWELAAKHKDSKVLPVSHELEVGFPKHFSQK